MIETCNLSVSKLNMYAVKVIGLGNRMHGDDGLGSCLALALKKCSAEAPPILALDLPTLGDVYLLEDSDTVIIIDAADKHTLEALGVSEHGIPVILELKPERLGDEDLALMASKADAHTLDPVYLVAYAYSAGFFRGRAFLIAVPIEEVRFGVGLTEAAAMKALEAAEVLARLLESLGHKLSYNKECLKAKLLGPCRDPLAPL